MEKTAPSFTTELVDQRVEELSPVKLKVTFKGKPRPEVKWFFNNKLIQRTDSVEIETTDTSSILTLKRLHPEQHGKYICNLTNEVGATKSKCWVQVIG